MRDNLDWMDDIEYRDLLTSDMKLIIDRCGEHVLRSLLANIPMINIYLSEKPLVEAQKRYIELYYRQGNAKEIATRLGVSERFVFKTHKDIVREKHKSRQRPKSQGLFD